MCITGKRNLDDERVWFCRRAIDYFIGVALLIWTDTASNGRPSAYSLTLHAIFSNGTRE